MKVDGSDNKLQRIAVCVIPRGCSRHNAPGRPHAVTDLVRTNKGSIVYCIIQFKYTSTPFSSIFHQRNYYHYNPYVGTGDVTVVLLNENPTTTNFSTCCAVARAFSTYAIRKTARTTVTVNVYVNQPTAEHLTCTSATNIAQSIQLCQKLVGKWQY